MMKSEKRLEKAKKYYLEALKDFEQDEERRLAMLYQPKVSLNNIIHYSAYMQGARTAVMRYGEWIKQGKRGRKGEERIYLDAEYKLITSDLRHTALWLEGATSIYYRNHVRDKKGKLVSVEAYFGERVTRVRELR
jgi:hypothetical protein